MRIEKYCIAVAATAALCGMGLGIFVAVIPGCTLLPAHAHLNLLGWVSMALYGLYYRGAALLRGTSRASRPVSPSSASC